MQCDGQKSENMREKKQQKIGHHKGTQVVNQKFIMLRVFQASWVVEVYWTKTEPHHLGVITRLTSN